MLGVRYCKEEPIEPMIIVLEKVHVTTLPEKDHKFPFVLNLDAGSVTFYSKSEKQREEWMVKVSEIVFKLTKSK